LVPGPEFQPWQPVTIRNSNQVENQHENSTHSIITAAVLALSTSSLLASGEAMAAKQDFEKCYGVAKVGKNDCQTATSSCTGTAKGNRQTDAFIAVPKGTCSKIAGGELTAG
jgi:uncharacterized membrane protein